MNINLVVAMTKERVIGSKGRLPWHCSKDLKHFKAITTGKVVVMGRKTYDSIGKPLPNRTNIVITSTPIEEKNLIAYSNLQKVIQEAQHIGQDLYFIGGARIYENTLSIANRIYLTIIHEVHSGDVFFPHINVNEWRITDEEAYPECTFKTLERIV